MLSRLAIAVLLAPSCALAQNSTTDCQRDYFGNVHCTTQAQPGVSVAPPLDYGKLLQSGENAVPSYADQVRQEQQLRAARGALDAREQTQRAAQMIGAGDCAGAEKFALKAGNLALAQQVRDYCQK
jgi:hypothetical protein